jgi:hypothetical protein
MDDNNSSVITRNVVTLGYDIDKSFDVTNMALKTVSLGTSSSYHGTFNNVCNNATLGTSTAFDCTAYGVNAFISYNDSSTTNTSRVYVYASNQASASFSVCYCIGVLDPLLNATGTLRLAFSNINLSPFKTLYLYNGLTSTGVIANANCSIVD